MKCQSMRWSSPNLKVAVARSSSVNAFRKLSAVDFMSATTTETLAETRFEDAIANTIDNAIRYPRGFMGIIDAGFYFENQ